MFLPFLEIFLSFKEFKRFFRRIRRNSHVFLRNVTNQFDESISVNLAAQTLPHLRSEKLKCCLLALPKKEGDAHVAECQNREQARQLHHGCNARNANLANFEEGCLSSIAAASKRKDDFSMKKYRLSSDSGGY